MPIHDWPLAPLGFFHHFYHRWSGAICDALNDGRLPKGYYALVELTTIGLVPDVLTLQRQPPAPIGAGAGPRRAGGVAVADAPPKVRFVRKAEENLVLAKTNRVVVRESAGQVVAVIEIVSPGNKSSKYALKSFVDETTKMLSEQINV